MANDLVSYSRAGDVFHYRWAARRCLRLIYPNTSLRKIYVEGSPESKKAGEYVIDVSEHYIFDDGKEKIDYYQLKHSTVQQEDSFTLSKLEDTFTGFAARFTDHKSDRNSNISSISFTVITNRKVADSFKKKLLAIANKQTVDNTFKETIEKYTKLTSDDLALFCSLVHLEDSEGDYNVQRDELRIELAQLIAGSIDNAQIDNLVALVQDKILPDADGSINREEVLKRFGISSERELYPAPAQWEEIINIIKRKQHSLLEQSIYQSTQPIIIHAAGGVGKSVLCRQLVSSLPEGSIGIAYDCFGAGSYRNRSETRHRHRDALVQIANELSSKGLCDPLIVQNTTLDEDIMRKFLSRVEASINSLKKTIATAQLYIIIDAADNAEMAAKDFNQSCFAHELLKERIPNDCKLILLCRTERISLLQPPSTALLIELEPFSEQETLENIRRWFPEANEKDGIEFHKLTSRNPRVQANALDVKFKSVDELLSSLGPSGTSVEDQIQLQLNNAISKIKDQIPSSHHEQVHSICLGLASLPPHIPIDVLSMIAGVSIEHVKSFVSDIGRSLWLFDKSIQFRDEPTETWFRNTFLATPKNCQEYIHLLEPLANKSSYIAEVLPQLYLLSEQYDKLISIALSEEYLPENPIDARNVRVYRLQFAFKAALRLKNYKDAVKLAMRAGEEVAGNKRLLALFQNNIDLLTILQSKEKVQEIAFKRLLTSGWDGSENLYSASLLSGIKEYHGEATGYLRASINWLHIYFEESEKSQKLNHRNLVQDDDILELAYATINIHGVKGCADFLFSLNPKEAVFRTIQDLVRRLIDIGRIKEVDELLHLFIRMPYYVIATTSELIKIRKFPELEELETCLNLLCSKRGRIPKPQISYDDRITPAIISFLEACLVRNFPPKMILRVLMHYVPIKASRMVYSSYESKERTLYLKALAIRTLLSGNDEINIESIYPIEFSSKKKTRDQENDIKEFKEIVHGLFPWFLLRAKILYNKNIKHFESIDAVNEISKKARSGRYRTYDSLPQEIADVCSSILILCSSASQEDLANFYLRFLQNEITFELNTRLNTLRAAYRVPHLSFIRQQLELSIYNIIKNHSDGPDEIASRYIALSRAVLINSIDDASVYFENAVNIVSKFGDEIVRRWEATVSLALRASIGVEVSKELAYRFIRCAELVGENVSREKYWDRNYAIQVCTKLSPGIAISALSRWRDRDVGYFDDQLHSILTELVSNRVIPASVGWSLNRFFSDHQINDFLSICLKNETINDLKKKILDDAVHLLQIEGTNKDYWNEVLTIAKEHNIYSEALEKIFNFYSKQTTIVGTESIYDKRPNKNYEEGWSYVFDGINISTSEGFKTLVERLKYREGEAYNEYQIRDLIKEAFARLNEKSLWDFMDTISLSNYMSRYDIQEALLLIPHEWKSRVSFKGKLLKFMHRFGQRYSYEFSCGYSFNTFLRELKCEEDLVQSLVSGIISGLSNGNDFADTDLFFGFVKLISHNIEVADAVDLLDYSISRFEIHIEENFGDGRWADRLNVPDNINENIAGFIWSALASPRSHIRWNALHCVKKLADFNNVNVLDSLVYWLKYNKVDAFGYDKFLFYNLHARQYLLMAFSRISVEKPELLIKYNELFQNYALSEEHILIQKFASAIALKIESAFPNTYDKKTLNSIRQIGRTGFPTQVEDYQFSTDSFWHGENTVDTSINFHFGLDFDQYWFEPLGRLFGVTSKQIQELVTHLIVKEWKLGDRNGYNEDPRVILWNRSSNNRETWHHHGNYPRTDNLDFYLSYHAIFVVAARLINEMPVVKRKEWYTDDDDEIEWISYHLPTRDDGKWLSDCRDPLPLNRPKWIGETQNDTWQTEVTEQDFINSLIIEDEGELWINVKGNWQEKDNDRIERISISSALVSTKTSNSLLRALETCSDPYDYKLPDFSEDDKEIQTGIFRLSGWINERSISKRFDKFDPYADEVDYPPYSLGNTIVERLELIDDENGKIWKNINEQIVVKCETWSSKRLDRDEEPAQSGMILKASLPILKHLCETYDCDLIFEVSIEREVSTRYGKREYNKPKHKLFILSVDGKLRTTNKDYRLG